MEKNIISSRENESIKHIKKLKDKKQREISNEYIIEGIRIVEEALLENIVIKKVVICEELLNKNITENIKNNIKEKDIMYVTENVFKAISEVESPQGILLVIDKSNNGLEIDLSEDIIVCLDDIQDPGNMGTILRTLDSIGLKQVIVSPNTVDMYNPKVLRSTMGAAFRVKVFREEDIEETLKNLKDKGFEIIVTTPNTSTNIYEIDYMKKIIVIGNEGNGVREQIIQIADKKVKIPMPGKAESLNASIAAGIVLYEYVRQNLK